ncbi:MAG: purine-nucleoside phosphorylase [Bacteroidetes bacterium]|nr:purine-nucleoside phosphorylase [Bacteroidota bacterium]
MISEINAAAAFIRTKTNLKPETGIILGTGLGNDFVSHIQEPVVIEYKDIPHFPISTVEFHKGRLILGKMEGKLIVAMQGRFHYYEGYSMQQITFPVRVLGALGIKRLLISNAAGNLNVSWKKGDLMLIDDHINLQPDNPLRGHLEESLGPRFPDMSRPYNKLLNAKLTAIAKKEGILLRTGVYVSVMGPNLETRAEYRYLRQIGANAVGMSTVPEVIVCAHMQLDCCAVSVLTDDCDPDHLEPVKIEDILAVAAGSEKKLTKLFTRLISEI